MDLRQITEGFLASFKILNVEIKLSDHICNEVDWDGVEYIVYEDSNYCPCEIKVDGLNSIAEYEARFKNKEETFLSKFRDWKKDQSYIQIHEDIFDAIYLINSVLSLYGISKSHEVRIFYNDSMEYVTSDLFNHSGIITTKVGEEKHGGKVFRLDYENELSCYIQTQYKILIHIKNYLIGFDENLSKTQPLNIHDSFTLKVGIQFNLNKAAGLKNYLETKRMILDGDTYDFYRLFRNEKLYNKIKWIKGPGHLKHFLRILKKEGIVEKKHYYEIAVQCFEFVGEEYNKPITKESITHGYLPIKTLITTQRILEAFI